MPMESVSGYGQQSTATCRKFSIIRLILIIIDGWRKLYLVQCPAERLGTEITVSERWWTRHRLVSCIEPDLFSSPPMERHNRIALWTTSQLIHLTKLHLRCIANCDSQMGIGLVETHRTYPISITSTLL